ncbi:UNVERIFIED_CONTAM: DNA-directed RNA polymerase II RPB1 [Hammondia hammondi]|eukprot:XP_008881907.1 DNA-directed RNA polymerase II RPB1 [Hammondia hammondi]
MSSLSSSAALYSSAPLKRVDQLQFGVFSSEQLRKMSVCEVTTSELYEHGMPKANGLNDLRLGTLDYRQQCRTCNMDVKNCPGHFGHLNLVKPVYHYGFLGAVLRVLRCVCYACGKLLVDRRDPKMQHILKIRSPSRRLKHVLDACAGRKRCEGYLPLPADGLPVPLAEEGEGGCGCVQPRYFKEGPNIMVLFPDNREEGDEDVTEDIRRIFAAEEAYAVLRRISEEDLKMMGFDPERAHPASFILSTLPIPPLAVRPSVQYGSARSEDDLTLKLVDIVKTNLSLKRQGDSVPSAVLQEMVMLLQYHVTTLFDNDIPGMPVATTRGKKPIKSIRARLKGKEGRLRGNLMGKRVDFSARTVITGDPMLPIDTVGVPKSIAMTLTYPEFVTPLNIGQLRQLVKTGPFDWPGAKYVIRDDGSRFDLRHAKKGGEVVLEVGYRVERHMRDGDFVLFNRQPSLHKMSIMGHQVKILPYSTFRLNLSVTSPYNADFDGDEMNLHLAQSEETRAEIKHLMKVPKQIVSPQGNKPVMGIVQDSLLAVSKFTRRDTFLTKPMVYNLLLQIPYWSGVVPPPAILHPVPLWTGKQLFSLLLFFDSSVSGGNTKTRINMQRDVGAGLVDRKKENLFLSERDERVIIRQGELLAGKICKKIVGSASGSLIHLLWLEAGPERTKDFLSTLQKLTNYWLLHQGFTVGCKDIIANEETNEKVRDILDQAKKEVDKLIRLAHRGRLESQPGKSLRESFEARVNKELNSARERSGKVAAESLDESNNIMAMVLAGSKGSTINISQIMACVGQQNVEGKRIPFGFNERSLPHFHKFDYSPQSRGFVENSYLSGLEPHELFFHAMGGREGIIDTACKTSETGYIQRRLMKAMEDVMVYYDRTVRNSICEVLQFLYGEDGMSGEFVEDQTVELMTLDNEKLKRLYRHDVDQESYGKGWLSDELRNEILTDYELQQPLEEEFEAIREDKNRLCRHIFKDGETKQHIPINILRLLEFAKAQFPSGDSSRKQSPIEIARKVNELLNEKLVVVKQTTNADAISAEVQENATIFMKAHLRTVLNSRRLLERECIGPKALQWLLGEVERHFHRALAHAGECVGAIAAQSIGEPATQMTLNTFHFAGVGSKNVTLGVPRLKELINVAKQVKTPSLTVYLQDEIAMDQERAKDVQTHLEHTTLDRVTVVSQVIYDPDPTDTIIPQDRQWVRDYYEFPDDDELPSNLGRWLLRIQMASKVMIDKKLTMKEIGEKIYAEFPNEELDCIWTDDNSDDLVLRIRLKQQPGEGEDEDKDEDDVAEAGDRFLQKLMVQCLAGITLRGITNISKVYMREEARTVYNNQLGKFERTNNWVLDTDGCNLEDVLPIPMVDDTRTTSNDMTEIFHVLGIEAVRRALLRELRAVISFDGSYVNYRHLAILCDTMTQKGYLMSITRHGINRIDKGPLMKCSFEETVEILMEAAVFAEADHLRGVTENIMMGQLCPLGTGYFDVLIDEEKLKDASHNLDGLGGAGEFDGGVGTSPSSDPLVITPDGSFTPSPHLNSVFSPMPFSTVYSSFAASPANPLSPTTLGTNAGVDTQQLGGKFSPTQQTPRSPTSPLSPLSCFSPRNPLSPLSPSGPPGGIFSPTSPILGSALETSSPSYSPSSPQSAYFQNDGSSSAVDMVISPGGVGSDGRGRGGSYSPTSPTLSPSYSPSSPPSYSPTSPAYSPTSALSIASPVPGGGGDGRMPLSPFSPSNNPMSPHFSASPSYSPTSPVQQSNPTSPTSPYSPAYSPTSPRYSPTSPMYSPTFAPYSPQSPSYGAGQGPLSPSFIVQSPRYSPSSPAAYSPTSPMPNVAGSPSYENSHAPGGGTYSPTSPMYEANDPFSPDPFAAEVVDEVGDVAALESPTEDTRGPNQGRGGSA